MHTNAASTAQHCIVIQLRGTLHAVHISQEPVSCSTGKALSTYGICPSALTWLLHLTALKTVNDCYKVRIGYLPEIQWARAWLKEIIDDLIIDLTVGTCDFELLVRLLGLHASFGQHTLQMSGTSCCPMAIALESIDGLAAVYIRGYSAPQNVGRQTDGGTLLHDSIIDTSCCNMRPMLA